MNLISDYGSEAACHIKFPTGVHPLKKKPNLWKSKTENENDSGLLLMLQSALCFVKAFSVEIYK